MEMTRRGFFKVVGGLAAAAALPTTLLEAATAVPAGAIELGLVREIMQYELTRDMFVYRMDVYAKDIGVQLHCDALIYREHIDDKEKMSELRDTCKGQIERMMKDRGISWTDLKPLPIPDGALTLQQAMEGAR